MKIKLKKKENKYAQVHVDMLRNKNLSLKAKGLGAVLESYSNDFEVSLKSIELNATDGIKSIRSAIKELEDGYYLFRFQTREKAGLFTTYWAFDSEQLDTEYLKNMIVELEKVELITKNELLQRGIPHGNAVTGMPSTGSRSTGSRPRTTYNNTNYQNKLDHNNPIVGDKVKLSLSEEVAEYRQKLLNCGHIGRLATVKVEDKVEDVFLDENGLLYTSSKTTKQLLSSTINEIYNQLFEINESRKNSDTERLQAMLGGLTV